MCKAVFSYSKSKSNDNKKGSSAGKKDDDATTPAVSFLALVASYQNHVLYCSVYVALILTLGRAASECYISSKLLQAAMYLLGAAMVALALKYEVVYAVQRRRLPPGDSGWPVVGHLFHVLADNEAVFIQSITKYGNLSTHNLLMNPVVILTTDEDVQWALTQERKGLTKAFFMPHLVKLVGEEAIMVKSGDEHKRLRKVFEPTFTPLAIRDYAAVIDQQAQERLKIWCDSGEFQTPREWALLAMRIFFVCAFGSADEQRLETLASLFENWISGFTAPIPFAIPGTRLALGHYYKNELGKLLLEMIDEFKAANPPGSGTEAETKSIMGRLCYAVDDEGNAPSDLQLVDNLRFFLFAGFDTTKLTFCGISHFLSQRPELVELLVEEVQGLKEPLDIDELKHEAPILNAVMAETWRLNAPLTSHSTVATQDLEYKGYLIPKGTFVAADIHGHAQLNEERYPGARDFRFERWLPKDHPLYQPELDQGEDIDYNVMSAKFRTFNMGSHMCLGGHFAKLEVRIVLARVFQSYKVDIRNERVKKFPMKQLLNEFKISKQ